MTTVLTQSEWKKLKKDWQRHIAINDTFVANIKNHIVRATVIQNQENNELECKYTIDDKPASIEEIDTLCEKLLVKNTKDLF